MTPDQTALILTTADAAFASGRFADCFYNRLFAIAPETRLLFSADLTALKLKFMNTLSILVGSIQHPAMFAFIVAHLGGQHRRYGVMPIHYEAVGKALRATLHDILGERLSPRCAMPGQRSTPRSRNRCRRAGERDELHSGWPLA